VSLSAQVKARSREYLCLADPAPSFLRSFAVRLSIGHDAIAIQGDISNLRDLERVFAQIKADKGRVDVLFANAGLGDLEPIGAITEDSFDRTFGVNVKGACS
jgi:NAD(P)-dependent dehydrogenase (short-subunit alcohol dehydrogenase family)